MIILLSVLGRNLYISCEHPHTRTLLQFMIYPTKQGRKISGKVVLANSSVACASGWITCVGIKMLITLTATLLKAAFGKEEDD